MVMKFITCLETDLQHPAFDGDNWTAAELFCRWNNLVDYKSSILAHFCSPGPTQILPEHCIIFLNNYVSKQTSAISHAPGRNSLYKDKLVHGSMLKARTGLKSHPDQHMSATICVLISTPFALISAHLLHHVY